MTVLSNLTNSGVREFLGRVATVDGLNQWDPQVRDDDFFGMVAGDGMLGLGNAYVKGYWECEDLFEFFCRAIRGGLLEFMADSPVMKALMTAYRTTNRQSQTQAKKNVVAHYDRGNDLFEAFLGKTMAYTCAVWDNPLDLEEGETLDEAQERKLDRICQKLHLESGMRVLDIGCGWGPFMRYVAGHFEVEVVGITLSAEQIAYIEKRNGGFKHSGSLPIKAVLADFRTFDAGKFDRVLSIGMFEHVGRKNHEEYFKAVDRCLESDGLSLIHCFGKSDPRVPLIDPWTEKHIFPGMELPTVVDITTAMEGAFNLLDLEEMGQHYPKTLLAWSANFDCNWEQISHYGEEFRRMWRYYLLSCAAVFHVRKVLLWQVVFARKEDGQLYEPVR